MRLIGTLFKGVHLIFHPRLALSADQIKKFNEGDDRYGSIEAINLDKVGTPPVLRKIIHRMNKLKRDTTTTMFLICSPQLMAENEFLVEILDI